ncbi:MAG: response regulator transcription factor [Planctomycetota bacterium]|nr:response regulator transcription factor [Planctomycetota bacterium]
MCIDDNELLIDCLRRLCAQHAWIEWAGAATSDRGVVDLVRARRPHVILLDVDMPGIDTFALVASIFAAAPDARVLMLSGHLKPVDIERAFDSGVWGYMCKSDDPWLIFDGVRRVARGEVVLSDDARAVHTHHPPRSRAAPPPTGPSTRSNDFSTGNA